VINALLFTTIARTALVSHARNEYLEHRIMTLALVLSPT